MPFTYAMCARAPKAQMVGVAPCRAAAGRGRQSFRAVRRLSEIRKIRSLGYVRFLVVARTSWRSEFGRPNSDRGRRGFWGADAGDVADVRVHRRSRPPRREFGLPNSGRQEGHAPPPSLQTKTPDLLTSEGRCTARVLCLPRPAAARHGVTPNLLLLHALAPGL